MQSLRRHFARCLIAGIVAILPIAGLTVTIVYFESLVAGSWLKEQGFYFFGLGLLILVALIYLVGLLVSTVIGRWLWRWADRLLDRLPLLGNLYQTLKQILGYGDGPDALFRRAVWIATQDKDIWELGLVTCERSPQCEGRLTVFVPHAPNPTTGRLVLVEIDRTVPCAMTVHQVMQLLVSMGTLTGQASDSGKPPS